MKAKELQSKNDAELMKDLAALQEKTREMRFKIHSQELKNTKDLPKARKDIARILTILKQRETK